MESNLDRNQDGHPAGWTLMAALDRELSAPENLAVEEHVTKCPECGAQWERLRQVSGRLTEFRQSISSLPEFELHLPPAEKPATRLDGIVSLLRRPRFLVPAAALATAVIGLTLWTNSRAGISYREAPAPPVVNVPAKTETIAASKPAIPAAPETQASAIQTPRHLRSRSPAQEGHLQGNAPNPAPNVPAPQTAEVFWYLPYSNPALADEGAEMVRADLPREAFLMAGVPLANIPAAGPRERIAADVLIGADGLPRAIRPARELTTAPVIPNRL